MGCMKRPRQHAVEVARRPVAEWCSALAEVPVECRALTRAHLRVRWMHITHRVRLRGLACGRASRHRGEFYEQVRKIW